MIRREEINNFIETFEVISNPSTMRQIVSSQSDIESGNIKVINSVYDI
jgi:hypothetical protein